jgi:hypothetical protein
MELRDMLEFCRKCKNRKVMEIGPINCALTNAIPDFEGCCVNYIKDESEPEKRLDDHFLLKPEEIKAQARSGIYEKIIHDQDFIKAAVLGSLIGLAGASLWAVIAFFAHVSSGFIAMLIGALVGLTVRYFGKGITLKFAILGSSISFLACLVGNFLMVIAFTSKEMSVPFFSIFSSLPLVNIPRIMWITMRPMDFVFYAIAIYEGFRFSKIGFTERSLWQYSKEHNDV